MGKEVLSKKEANRRGKIKRDLISKMLEIGRGEYPSFAPEALKNLSVIRVSLPVIKEIIIDEPYFENINDNTGTTRLSGIPVDIKYTLKTTGGLTIGQAFLGGKKAEETPVTKTIKKAHLLNNFDLSIYIDADKGYGDWVLTVSEIKQYLVDGSTYLRSLPSSPITITVRKDDDREYDKLKPTK